MTKPNDVSRREFLSGTARAAAGAALGGAALGRTQTAQAAPYKSILPQTVLGANETIRTGHIGVGGMGRANLNFMLHHDVFHPIAVCDLWPPHRDQAANIIGQKFDTPVTKHKDFREVLDNKDIDVVVIATPDHWHAIPCIMACEAGKDVYCEKPLGVTILEGEHMLEAARRNNTVVQTGLIQRSGPSFQESVQLIKEGYIGQVMRVETWIHDWAPKEGIGNPPDAEPPEELDWDFYLGWTPKVPYNENRFLYNFRWFLEYSGGRMTDWGVHLIDIVLWALGEDKFPNTVTAAGGKYYLEDNRTTPDTLDVLYEFDNFVVSFANKEHNGYTGAAGRHAILYHGSEGTLRVDRDGYEVIPGRDPQGRPKEIEPLTARGSQMYNDHFQNFIDCIRDRTRPISDIGVCHHTSSICHMGTCAYVAGGKLHWNAEENRFYGSDTEAVEKANAFAYRPYENGWSLKPPYYSAIA